MFKYSINLGGVDGIDEYLPTGEFRNPRPGDYFVTCAGTVRFWPHLPGQTMPRIILVKKPRRVFPSALKGIKDGKYLARDERGTWSLFRDKPVCTSVGWAGSAISAVDSTYYPELRALDILPWHQTLLVSDEHV